MRSGLRKGGGGGGEGRGDNLTLVVESFSLYGRGGENSSLNGRSVVEDTSRNNAVLVMNTRCGLK